MLAIAFLLLGFLPPLAVGPLAGLAFITLLKRDKMGYQIPFWASLLLLNLLFMFWVATSAGVWLPIASLTTFFLTPITPILTVLVMRKAWRRLEATKGVAAAHKRWYCFGLVLIPAVQIGMFVALLVFAPSLCKDGFLICRF
jgi:hypothetical protein